MNTRLRTLSRGIAATALAAQSAAVLAQTQQPTASNLGSPQAAASAASASTDYRALVEVALPRVSAEDLAARLRAVEKEGRAGLRVRDIRAWAALFDLPLDKLPVEPGAVGSGDIVELERGALQVREDGRLWAALRPSETKPVPRQEFARQLPEIRRAHMALAERIGIPRSQIFFTDFRETLAQSTPRPGLAERESAIESVGATTTLVRAVGGILVDGSFARIVSTDSRRLEMVDVRWPDILLAAGVASEKVQPPRALADRLLERVTHSAQKRPVRVMMAVVLRPLRTAYRTTTFVPSLRVGVVPRSESVKDGYRTDAGEVLYVDLVPGYEEKDQRERAPESFERKEEAGRR